MKRTNEGSYERYRAAAPDEAVLWERASSDWAGHAVDCDACIRGRACAVEQRLYDGCIAAFAALVRSGQGAARPGRQARAAR